MTSRSCLPQYGFHGYFFKMEKAYFFFKKRKKSEPISHSWPQEYAQGSGPFMWARLADSGRIFILCRHILRINYLSWTKYIYMGRVTQTPGFERIRVFIAGLPEPGKQNTTSEQMEAQKPLLS